MKTYAMCRKGENSIVPNTMKQGSV